MSSSQYGRKLNPYRRLHDPFGVKGHRQTITVTNTPSMIDQLETLLVRFPDLRKDVVIIPGSVRLAFDISLDSTDINQTLMQNIGCCIIKKLTIRLSGNEILSIDDFDVYHSYLDLWKTTRERSIAHHQGIDAGPGRNATKLQVGAVDGVQTLVDSAIAKAYRNWFYILLDFELLESHMPYYQAALGDRLEFEIVTNRYDRVIQAAGDAAASYRVTNIKLKFDVVNHPQLARLISNQYAGHLAIQYDRVHCYRRILKNKSDPSFTVNIDPPARSMKSIIMLFEDPAGQPYQWDTETFYNPQITRVDCTIDGMPNQVYSQGMQPDDLWDEARKFFGSFSKCYPGVGMVLKDAGLADVIPGGVLHHEILPRH